jgi:hypothetical protein
MSLQVGDRRYPPLRQQNQPDGHDAARIAYVTERWAAQDGLLVAYSRQVEHHCRMLAGQQWDVWSEALGKFLDINSLFSQEEALWKQRPVVNYLTYWYMLTHARLTENPPILTFQPATADRVDAQLAETYDTVFKTLWNQTHMPEVVDTMMGWVVAAGTGYIKSYPIDDPREEAQPRVGPATAQMPDEMGEPVEHELDEPVPYDDMGSPQFELQPHPETGDMVAMPTADPTMLRPQTLGTCALNPLQVRGEWNQKPWHEKTWHTHKDYFPPAVVEERWGIALEPDVSVNGSDAGPGYLERLLFNAGHYGSVYGGGVGMVGNAVFGVGAAPTDGYVCVYEQWELPTPQNDMLGRLTVISKDTVLYDGPRPFRKLQAASPINKFQFVGLPGRPAGTTPCEFLVPLQQSINRGWAQALEHGSLMTNPMLLVDSQAGLDEEQFEAVPGVTVWGGLQNGIPMVVPLQMPPLSPDFWRIMEMKRETFFVLGNITGTEGSAPTDDASGELVSQLRANSDRFIGPTARGLVMEMGRLAENWLAILAVIWDQPKLIAYAGEDNVPQTIAVEPYLWSGSVNAVPDVESMLPEGRGEKQAKVMGLWQAGWFGDPADPATQAKVAPMMRFPNLNRASMPGGVDGVTASQNLGQLLLGTPPHEIPLFDAYDFGVHLQVTQQHIKSPEFKRNTPEIQQGILGYAEVLEQRSAIAMIQQAQKAQAVAAAIAPPQPSTPDGPSDSASHTSPPAEARAGLNLVS